VAASLSVPEITDDEEISTDADEKPSGKYAHN
jgi:hypothetical protein